MADYQYILETGLIVPDTGAVLTDVQTEFQTAFGQDLVTSPETPQGVLITAETLARDEVIRNNAALANQINPNVAGGVFLDSIWALTGGARDAQVFSTTNLNLTGEPGTTVPSGIVVRAPGGTDLFITTSVVVLNSTGTGVAPAQAEVAGPIAALPNTLTQIVVGVLGLETVTNPAAAMLGQLTQSDESARAERKVTLALQGNSMAEAIISALYATSGVVSLKFRENKAAGTVIIDGVSMVGHSLYVCVDGGFDLDVATSIYEKKSGGCDYNRDAVMGLGVTINVLEPASGQIFPVSFDRPQLAPVLARVTISAGSTVTDPETVVTQAILDYANSLIPGEDGFKVGVSVSAFELAGAINQESPGIFVKDLQITLASSVSYGYVTIPIAIYQKATIQASSIQVIIV